MNCTLVLFKPDCVDRGLVGECLARFERRGFTIEAIRRFSPAEVEERIERHYAEHVNKDYYPYLKRLMLKGPLVACLLENGRNSVEFARGLIGPYNFPVPGTIRGDFSTSPMDNVVHASASDDEAANERQIWFPGD